VSDGKASVLQIHADPFEREYFHRTATLLDYDGVNISEVNAAFESGFKVASLFIIPGGAT